MRLLECVLKFELCTLFSARNESNLFSNVSSSIKLKFYLLKLLNKDRIAVGTEIRAPMFTVPDVYNKIQSVILSWISQIYVKEPTEVKVYMNKDKCDPSNGKAFLNLAASLPCKQYHHFEIRHPWPGPCQRGLASLFWSPEPSPQFVSTHSLNAFPSLQIQLTLNGPCAHHRKLSTYIQILKLIFTFVLCPSLVVLGMTRPGSFG